MAVVQMSNVNTNTNTNTNNLQIQIQMQMQIQMIKVQMAGVQTMGDVATPNGSIRLPQMQCCMGPIHT